MLFITVVITGSLPPFLKGETSAIKATTATNNSFAHIPNSSDSYDSYGKKYKPKKKTDSKMEEEYMQ